MTGIQITLLCLVAFMVGANVSLYLTGKFLIEPLRKSYKAALDGWEQSVKLLQEVTGIRPDVSIRSPIQIHKHE